MWVRPTNSTLTQWGLKSMVDILRATVQNEFLELNLLYFIQNLFQCFLCGLVHNMPSLLHVIQWCQNERHGVSYHRRLDCLLNHLFRYTSKKNESSASLAFLTGGFPLQRASNAEMFLFGVVIMVVCLVTTNNGTISKYGLYAQKLWTNDTLVLNSPLNCHIWTNSWKSRNGKPCYWHLIYIIDTFALEARTLLQQRTNGALQWRHNGHDDVSNHQPHGRLLNRLFRRRSKKTSKLRVTGLCVGISPGPHKGPVTRKMFPFDDVIMVLQYVT